MSDDELTSAQGEYDKNVTVVLRNMCITQRKIVRNIFKCNWENIEKMFCAKCQRSELDKYSSKNRDHFSLLLVNRIEYY